MTGESQWATPTLAQGQGLAQAQGQGLVETQLPIDPSTMTTTGNNTTSFVKILRLFPVVTHLLTTTPPTILRLIPVVTHLLTTTTPPPRTVLLLPGLDLPLDWMAVTDENTGDIYYANTVTGVTQWDPPSAL